ncbi:hypothetical protein JIX56_03600 [Streptomyces sp. CA-210063]|uniref:hypothetical protein n=1 Tax=Streptomyces sp. CA-210063 TaxID=2801029 RepID=UPI00214AEEC7|nr:hypothetical protein [Streptomyces sp. CA-210063]UUU29056.1 hypothetical protein JIX56_03600 [Streptomyces sp. CA-210063]
MNSRRVVGSRSGPIVLAYGGSGGHGPIVLLAPSSAERGDPWGGPAPRLSHQVA